MVSRIRKRITSPSVQRIQWFDKGLHTLAFEHDAHIRMLPAYNIQIDMEHFDATHHC